MYPSVARRNCREFRNVMAVVGVGIGIGSSSYAYSRINFYLYFYKDWVSAFTVLRVYHMQIGLCVYVFFTRSKNICWSLKSNNLRTYFRLETNEL